MFEPRIYCPKVPIKRRMEGICKGAQPQVNVIGLIVSWGENPTAGSGWKFASGFDLAAMASQCIALKLRC